MDAAEGGQQGVNWGDGGQETGDRRESDPQGTRTRRKEAGGKDAGGKEARGQQPRGKQSGDSLEAKWDNGGWALPIAC